MGDGGEGLAAHLITSSNEHFDGGLLVAKLVLVRARAAIMTQSLGNARVMMQSRRSPLERH